MPPMSVDLIVYEGSDCLGLMGNIGKLYNSYFARPICGHRNQNARLSIYIVAYECIGNGDNSCRATTAFEKFTIGRSRVRIQKGSYASRMRMLKAIERLIIISNNAQRCCCAQKIDNGLLSLV